MLFSLYSQQRLCICVYTYMSTVCTVYVWWCDAPSVICHQNCAVPIWKIGITLIITPAIIMAWSVNYDSPPPLLPYLRSICADGMARWVSTVHLRSGNEFYRSCTPAVHQQLHFSTCINTAFHRRGGTLFSTLTEAIAMCPVSSQTSGNCQGRECNWNILETFRKHWLVLCCKSGVLS